MLLRIQQDGMVHYERKTGVTSRRVDAPIQRFDGADFVVGVGPFATTFHVSEAPHREGDEWRMTVDGVELVRVAKPLPIPAPGEGTPI